MLIIFNELYFFFNGKEKFVYVLLIKEYKKVFLFLVRYIVIICILKYMLKMYLFVLFLYILINCMKICFYKWFRDFVRK